MNMVMDTPQPERAPKSRRAELSSHVGRAAARLQAAYLNSGHPQHSMATAQLARLRRAAPDDPSDPTVWDVVFADFPENGKGHLDTPTPDEIAAYSVLTLFGVHMQGATVPRHVPGQGLGLAIGRLARLGGDEPDGAVSRRFQSFATATTYAQRVSHLRNLIALLRSSGAPLGLDYGRLAADLYTVQFPGGVNRVRLQWGRDFHTRKPHHAADDTSPEKEN